MAEKILIVDDEVDMLGLLKLIIADKTDYAVDTTNNPFEVIDLIKTGDYEVLITDLKMPGIHGIEFVDQVKEIDEYLPVIIITAYGSAESAEEAMAKGAYDYITKPFRKEQILITIDGAMEWRKMKRELSFLKGKIGH
ncbi:MAG: response regulator [Pseudomonadota bacterium]